jgi:hypothetical protein
MAASKYSYCVHVTSGNLYFSTLAEAKRQARNLARASQCEVLITREPTEEIR